MLNVFIVSSVTNPRIVAIFQTDRPRNGGKSKPEAVGI